MLVVFLEAVQIRETLGCPNHQHDFREEGFSVVTISVHSSVRWVTEDKKRFLGITVSSRRDQGAVEISKRMLIKSAVTVCSKCRMATGMVFMTLDQLLPYNRHCSHFCLKLLQRSEIGFDNKPRTYERTAD